MASKINYNNKAPFQTREDIPDINKVNAEDMNEIKSVVNTNSDELDTAKENIENLQNGQGTSNAEITSLKNRVTALETDNTTNKQNIQNLQTENETNKSDIEELQEDNETNKTNITNLQNNKVDKVEGKGLSTNDFDNTYKEKLNGLSNYDDTEIKQDITELEGKVSTLEEDNTTNKTNIKTLQEDNIKNKQDISDLQESQNKQNEVLNDVIYNLFPSETQEGENVNIKNTIPVKLKELVVKGNSKQETRSGKNIFNKSATPDVITNAQILEVDTGVKVETYTEGNTSLVFYKLKDISGFIGKTIRFKTKILPIDENSFPMYAIGLCDENAENRTLKQSANISNKELSFTIDASDVETKKFLGAWLYARSSDTIGGGGATFEDLIITVDNEDMIYEPYGAMPSPEYPSKIQNVEGDINVTVANKNLFTGLVKGISINSMGEVVERDTSSVSNFIKVDFDKNSRYYLSGLTNSLNSYVSFYNKDKQYLGRTPGNPQAFISFGANSLSSLVENYEDIEDKNIKFIKVSQYEIATSTGTIDDIDNLQIQLEPGTTATNYVEHQEQTVTFPLATGQKLYKGDYLAGDGIHHKRKQIELDYNDYTLQLISAGLCCLTSNNWDYTTAKGLCSHFKNAENDSIASNSSASALPDGYFNFRMGSTKDRIYFKNSNFATLEDWQNFFNNNNVILEYELAEEEIEAYTEEQQEAYKQICNLKAYEEETNVYSTNEISPIFKVTAIKDFNSVITQLNKALLERS